MYIKNQLSSSYRFVCELRVLELWLCLSVKAFGVSALFYQLQLSEIKCGVDGGLALRVFSAETKWSAIVVEAIEELWSRSSGPKGEQGLL